MCNDGLSLVTGPGRQLRVVRRPVSSNFKSFESSKLPVDAVLLAQMHRQVERPRTREATEIAVKMFTNDAMRVCWHRGQMLNTPGRHHGLRRDIHRLRKSFIGAITELRNAITAEQALQ